MSDTTPVPGTVGWIRVAMKGRATARVLAFIAELESEGVL